MYASVCVSLHHAHSLSLPLFQQAAGQLEAQHKRVLHAQVGLRHIHTYLASMDGDHADDGDSCSDDGCGGQHTHASTDTEWPNAFLRWLTTFVCIVFMQAGRKFRLLEGGDSQAGQEECEYMWYVYTFVNCHMHIGCTTDNHGKSLRKHCAR